MKNMRIGITGATGFIGKRLIQRLVSEHHTVTTLIHRKKEDFGKKVRVVQGDLVSKRGLRDFLRNIDCLIHLAARQLPPEEKMFEGNVSATNNLIQMVLDSSVKHLIYLSSATVYGETIYGLTKSLSEIICRYWESQTHGILTILRPFNVYGEGSTKGVIYNMLNNVRAGKPITIFGDGRQTRDFLYVDDLVEAIALSLKKKQAGAYNLGSGKNISLNGVIKIIEKILGRKVTVEYKESEPGKPKNILYSIEKTHRELGWKAAISLEAGLKRMLAGI